MPLNYEVKFYDYSMCHWGKSWQPTPVFLPVESPRAEKPGRLQSMGLQRVGHDWTTKHSTAMFVPLYIL